jgi:hypothetical protein
VVRYKIANMAREVEATHAFLEALAYRIVAVERKGENWMNALLRLGAEVRVTLKRVVHLLCPKRNRR